ncbi:MAG TPA: MFS transporter [Anaeromyxobacteraceae bacterium]|nr:MFS transporter [Anaeromyxobacteraceae bacterium]
MSDARATNPPLPASFWALWTGLLVNRAATFVVPFLGLYLVRDRGLSAAVAGQIMALYGLGSALSGPLGGALADRIGRKPTMLLGLLSSAAAVVGLAVARPPLVLAALTFASALLGETYRPAAHAAVADLVVAPAERRRAFGLVYWAVNLGMALGLLAAGLVAERSLLALFLADAATSVLCAGLVLWRVPESRPAGAEHDPVLAGMARVFRDGTYVTFLGLTVLGLAVFCQWQLALPLDLAAHGIGPAAFSWLMAFNCGGVVVLQPLLGRRLRTVDSGWLLAASAFLTGLGFGVNLWGGHLAVYVAGTLLWTLAEVVGFPCASSLVAELAPPELRGRYQGAYAMTWGAALMLSPLTAGAVLERWGAAAVWGGCLALGAALAAAHLAVAGPRRRRLAALAASRTDAPSVPGSAQPA